MRLPMKFNSQYEVAIKRDMTPQLASTDKSFSNKNKDNKLRSNSSNAHYKEIPLPIIYFPSKGLDASSKNKKELENTLLVNSSKT